MTEAQDPRTMLPSAREQYKLEQEKKAREIENTRRSMIREDFGRTFQTEHGKRVLAWFAQRCGWGVPPLAADKDGRIDPQMTTHNAMELSLYLTMRKFISVDVLTQVEYGHIKPSGTIEKEDDLKRKPSKPKSKKK